MDDMRSKKAMQKRPGQLFPHGQYGIPSSYGVRENEHLNEQSNLAMDAQVSNLDQVQ